MARRQRGAAARSGSWTDEPSLTLPDSDDEAPEEVTFEDSKVAALRSMKQALDTARREKELLKEKRRKRQALFKEQKKRKLLPADVLEEINASPSKKQKRYEHKAAKKATGRQKSKKKQRGKGARTRNLKGNYKVTMLKDQSRTFFQQQTAEEFIQSRLYGPGSCRTTSNELLSLENKRAINKSAAVQFVKKEWACKEKAKAEKLKKRWIHKQQIPPC